MFPFTKETETETVETVETRNSKIWKGININWRNITVGKVGTLVLNVENRIHLYDTLMRKGVILPRTSADVTERINAAII